MIVVQMNVIGDDDCDDDCADATALLRRSAIGADSDSKAILHISYSNSDAESEVGRSKVKRFDIGAFAEPNFHLKVD